MKKYPIIEQFRNVIRNVKAIHDYQVVRLTRCNG
jgi:hypothetical protein